MRARTVTALVATAGGLGLLFNFRTPSQARTLGSATVVAGGPPASGGAPPATDGATSGSPDTAAPAPSDSSGPAASDSAAPAPSDSTGSAPKSGRIVKIDGPVVGTQYGDVQVAVTLNGHQIVDVTALQLPTDRRRSAEISQQAAPLLREEVLQAQSAQIDTLGGATYTSIGYAESLQAALDKAGA